MTSLVMTVQESSSSQEEVEKMEPLPAAREGEEQGLEEGECSDEEEEQLQQEKVLTSPPQQQQPKGGGQLENNDKEPIEAAEQKSVKERKKRSRSGSREKHRSRKHKKRKDRKPGGEEQEKPMDEEAKKRALLKKLKALEGEMGLMPEESESEEGEEYMMEEEEEAAAATGLDMEFDENDPNFAFGERKLKRVVRERDMVKKGRICTLFMQGKCPWPPEDCLFSHDAEPPQVWELCKFYLFDRCVKKDKCLYLHKGFPCKYFHTGLDCKDDSVTCKFSHEPLNDMTRNLLLKHLETAPKEILGDFPRMSRAEAAETVYRVEALNNGWNLPGPDHRLGWEQQQAPRHWDARRQGGMGMLAGWDNSRVAMPPGAGWGERQQQQHGPLRQQPPVGWPDQRKNSGPPLAVQQAMAMEGLNADFGSGQGGIQGHEVRTRTAFNSGPVQRGAGAAGLLGAAPAQPAAVAKPTGLMEVKINEEMVSQFLQSQRDGEGTHNGDETPEVTPPVSRETTPIPSDTECDETGQELDEKKMAGGIPKMPQVQLKLFQRIQNKAGRQQPEAVSSERGAVVQEGSETSEQKAGTKGDSEDEYGEDDDKNVIVNVLKRLDSENSSPDVAGPPAPLQANTPLMLSNLPKELTNMLAAISSVKPSTHTSKQQQEKPMSPPGLPDGQAAATPVRKAERRLDPRRERQARREEEERLERERDQRILDLDLGSVFGDLELPPLAPAPQQTEEEKFLSDSLGLPFKPHIYQVAKEIEAGLSSHPPMEWVLRSVTVPRPDYSQMRHHCSPAQLDLDPRLRRYSARSTMAKMKELPLPAPGPVPKTDPRLKGRVDPRRQVAPSLPPTDERRHSSEDGEGNFVYNPAKELSKAKQVAAQLSGKASGVSWTAGEQADTFSPDQGDQLPMDADQLPAYSEEEAWLEEQGVMQQPGQQFFPGFGGNQAMFGHMPANFHADGRAGLMQHNFMMQQQFQANFQAQGQMMRGFAWNHGAVRQFGRGGGGVRPRGRPPFHQNRGGGGPA